MVKSNKSQVFYFSTDGLHGKCHLISMSHLMFLRSLMESHFGSVLLQQVSQVKKAIESFPMQIRLETILSGILCYFFLRIQDQYQSNQTGHEFFIYRYS